MNRTSHMIYGTCTTAAMGAITTFGLIELNYSPVFALPFALFGSYFPDIDVSNSRMRNNWKIFSICILPFALLPLLIFVPGLPENFSNWLDGALLYTIIGSALILINLAASRQLKHRTFTHSLDILLITLVLPIFLIGRLEIEPHLTHIFNTALIGFALGVFSHFVSDACTRNGVWISFPLKIKLHLLPKFMRIYTGKRSENIFTVVFVIIAFAIVGAALVIGSGLV
ncbi:MAG: metal-dependent hydrolase [Turicibacter sp.]|nr:metal-dependent hydrolase [Turicibacter sp.]